ncbi:GreA/GreB family elongation factor [Brevundimonas sp.]|uniref:GreA/GreB family elongation factor n=1 Tax=Brevundimonas sp. TaxID=1871086 RepID=UPI002FCAFA01
MASAKQNAPRKPRILITSQDLETLQTLLDHAPARTAGVDLLELELGRAVVVGESYNARPFCRLGSWATYEDAAGGQPSRIQLVLPSEADIDQQRVSVLTPVGACLLGLTPDAEIEWRDDRGRPHRLRLVEVANGEAAVE